MMILRTEEVFYIVIMMLRTLDPANAESRRGPVKVGMTST